MPMNKKGAWEPGPSPDSMPGGIVTPRAAARVKASDPWKALEAQIYAEGDDMAARYVGPRVSGPVSGVLEGQDAGSAYDAEESVEDKYATAGVCFTPSEPLSAPTADMVRGVLIALTVRVYDAGNDGERMDDAIDDAMRGLLVAGLRWR